MTLEQYRLEKARIAGMLMAGDWATPDGGSTSADLCVKNAKEILDAAGIGEPKE